MPDERIVPAPLTRHEFVARFVQRAMFCTTEDVVAHVALAYSDPGDVHDLLYDLWETGVLRSYPSPFTGVVTWLHADPASALPSPFTGVPPQPTPSETFTVTIGFAAPTAWARLLEDDGL